MNQIQRQKEILNRIDIIEKKLISFRNKALAYSLSDKEMFKRIFMENMNSTDQKTERYKLYYENRSSNFHYITTKNIINLYKKYRCKKFPTYYFNGLIYCEKYASQVFNDYEINLVKKLNRNSCLGNLPIFLVLKNCENYKSLDDIIRKIKHEKLIVTNDIYLANLITIFEITGINESISFPIMFN